jgi:phenylpropionate dioxygenase-like ring-hydroxylating dioxygenase large terminal subunit
MAPFADELRHYQSETMVPSGEIFTQTTPVNWKSVRDVDNEGYHVAMAHPALQDLYGQTYYDEPFVNGTTPSGSIYPVVHYEIPFSAVNGAIECGPNQNPMNGPGRAAANRASPQKASQGQGWCRPLSARMVTAGPCCPARKPVC